MTTADAKRTIPQTVDELVKVMLAAHGSGESLAFVGGGTELDFGYPPERVDSIVSTQRLTRIVEYAPDDMTVTVEAGVTLAALQATLAAHAQRLALDAPLPERATIGGLIATNGFGPRRARYGSLRDVILGASFVRADGVLVRGGGKVVKNVAGFDVPKLLVGSLGTLGCIATATLRLHPQPQTHAHVRVRCPGARELRALCADIVQRQLEPSAIVALNVSGELETAVLFEGFSAGVEQQAAQCVEGAQALGLPAAVEDTSRATRFWSMHEDSRVGSDVRVKVTYLPSALQELYDASLAAHARAFGDGAVVLYPSIGVAFCSASGGDLEPVARALNAGRAVAEKLGGSFVLLAAPAEVRERVDVYGTLPPSFVLMQRIKQRFDPARRCQPGRFLGRL